MPYSVSESFALFLYFCKHEVYFRGSCRNKGLFAKEMGCILTDLYYNKLEVRFVFWLIGRLVFRIQAPLRVC